MLAPLRVDNKAVDPWERREGAVSDFYIEKRRVSVRLVLAGGTSVAGDVFLSHSTDTHTGPEWVGDMLNRDRGFFPCEVAGERIILFNRAHVLVVWLVEPELDQSLDPSYSIANRQAVTLSLTNGEKLGGDLHVALPEGRNRISDFSRTDEQFRYFETPDGTCIVNFDHVVEIVPEA